VDVYNTPELKNKLNCRGVGYILSKGTLEGRLNFTFTASRDTAYIQFKDIIGRKALFLVVANDQIDAWDMQNNIRYDKQSIIIALPIFELIKPSELRTFLWGEIPNDFSNLDLISSRSEKLNGKIQFKSKQTELGPLVDFISFKMMEEKHEINFEIINREFDLQYPHLIKKIPQSIKFLKDRS
jgi:hypothetical protein